MVRKAALGVELRTRHCERSEANQAFHR